MSERIRLPCFKDTNKTLQVVEILASLRSLFMLFYAPRAELYFSEVATKATFQVDVA